MSGRPLSASEKRTIGFGAAALVAGLLWSVVIAPTARRWSDRESAIDAARDRVARLRGLGESAAQLMAVANTAPSGEVRVLQGRTVALIASDLQSLLQDLARSSRVSVNRMEVLTEGDSTATPERGIDAVVSATTDIYGLADFLTRVQSGTAMLSIESLQVEPNPVLRGNLLQVAMTVRTPFVVTP